MSRKRIKLANASDVRKAMSRISNMVLNGELGSKEANAIIYACNSVLTAIRVDEQQKKLDELEKLIINHDL